MSSALAHSDESALMFLSIFAIILVFIALLIFIFGGKD